MFIFAIVSLLIAALAVILALQNTAPTTVSFLMWSFQGSQALVLLAALFAGILISFFATLPSMLASRWTISRQKKKLAQLELSLSDSEKALAETKQKLQAQAQARAAEVKATPQST